MNQNVTENAFSLITEFPEYYTAVHFYCGIPLLRSILLKNVPENASGELKIKIAGLAGSAKVIDFTEIISDFSVCNYICKEPAVIQLNLEKNRILPNAKFIDALVSKTVARIQVSVEFAGVSAVTVTDIKFMPPYHIPARMSPELLCAYVQPGCDFAKRLSRNAVTFSKQINEKAGGILPRELSLTMALFSLLQKEKLTYSASLGEIFDSEAHLRAPNDIFALNSRAVSLTEASLIFCSCAERCGLSASIIYLRKGAGAVRVLVGIELIKNTLKKPVSESINELRERILSKEIFVFDVLGFLGTEETDFARNASETVQLIFKSSSTLSFSVDIALSRLCGVASLCASSETPKSKIQSHESLSEAIKKIEQNEIKNILYGFSPYTSASLGIVCKNALRIGETYTLTPLDDEVFTSDPDSLSLITTFDGNYGEKKSRNNAEQSLYISKLHALSNKISEYEKKGILHAYPSRYILKCDKPAFDRTREEFSKEIRTITDTYILSEIEGSSTNIFTATGVIEVCEKNKTLFIPCVFVPSKLCYSDGITKFTYGTESPVFNRSLCSYLGRRFGLEDEFITSDKTPDISTFLSRLKKLSEKFSGVKFHSDTLIACFDLSCTLVRECIENTSGKKFESYLESGRYEFSSGGASVGENFEATLPFECPSSLKSAVKYAENDSIVISGPAGSGKKKAVANIICRAAKNKSSVLVCSKHRDSLDSLYRIAEEAGLGELCLVAGSADETKGKIRKDLEGLKSQPSIPENEFDGDIDSLKAELDAYAEEMYTQYDFGYSLYDCIEEYCKYDALAEGSPADMQADAGELEASGASKLFSSSQKLSQSYIELLPALGGKTLGFYGFGHIRTTDTVRKDISKTIESAIDEISVFNQKSAFAKNALGFSDADISDMKSFSALGELFELIMKSGIDYIPEGLFSASTYRSAKSLEEFALVCTESCKTDNKLQRIAEKCQGISFTELYEKWCGEENKSLFAKEFKKSYSDKLSRKEMLEAVKLLDLKQRLEGEMSNLAPEAKILLGNLYDGKNTDTEKVLAIADFALKGDICVKKILTDNNNIEKFSSGISGLVNALFSDTQVNADFVLSVASFRNLTGTSDSSGFLEKISKALSVDINDIKFEGGFLVENGLSKLLGIWRDNIDTICLLPKYNLAKKEAIGLGLGGFVDYLENSTRTDADIFLKKSIFANLAEYIISSRPCLESKDIPEKCRLYLNLYTYQRKLASYTLLCYHKDKLKKYLSSAEGRSALYALTEALADRSVTASRLLSEHSLILREMYPALLSTNELAYRLKNDRDTLVLLDSESTSSCEGLALCAGFDKCVFLSSAFESAESIICSLPLGISKLELTHFGAEKIGLVSSFVANTYFGSEYTYTSDYDTERVKFIMCEGGLYDKSTLTNKIEAVKVCETAYECALSYGFENVGILAFTKNQVFEIKRALGLLAAKYADGRISAIPARYTGNLGDLSKKCIVLSATFGKNIYSITRSFADLDDTSMMFRESPCAFEKLLCAENVLYVVSSTLPQEIPVCTASRGAPAFKKLLELSKYASSPIKRSNGSNIPEKIVRESKCDFSRVYSFDGTVVTGNTATVYPSGYIRDTYDRIVLPLREYELHGYNAKFVDIFDLLK